MKNITIRQRLNYWFDNMMTGGTRVLILWLFIATLVMLLGIAVLASFTQDVQGVGLIRLFWMGLMRTLDPGTMGGDTGSWPFLFLMLSATVGGIFVVGTLIGVLTNGIDDRLDELRKGRSLVVEQGHTIILGWSSQIFSIISELIIANENHRHSCIAILAEKDKVEMEDEIHAKIGNSHGTRIVCRTGSPLDPVNLQIVNLNRARSIIILSPETDDPDSSVIKSILAIINNQNRPEEAYRIVAAIHNRENMEVAKLVGRAEAQIILSDDLISRITAQTCRQTGLSLVYTELLDYTGDEIYFKLEPLLIGKTFGEALFMFENSALIGLQTADGQVRLNPPMDTLIQPGDQVIAISQDDNTIQLSGLVGPNINLEAIRDSEPRQKQPEHTLILGWNHRAPMIIQEINNYVAPGSQLLVVADVDTDRLKQDCILCEQTNQHVELQKGETTNRRVLDRLEIQNFQHVIILSYSDILPTQEADARTLVTLLHLRDIAERFQHSFSIVSEMLDIRNRELAEVTHVDDFIVSDKLISLMLSQVSENKDLSAVFEDLFNPEGSEIYLKPAEYYIRLGEPLTFYTVLEAARRRGEVAIGYRLHANANLREKTYGVTINPRKSLQVTFSARDRIIVLAEDE
jgi:voltage-gated potassium channel Kch